VVWPGAEGRGSAFLSSRFDCFFRMQAAPGGGPTTGHIGRSLADRIKRCVHAHRRPTPSPTHQPGRCASTRQLPTASGLVAVGQPSATGRGYQRRTPQASRPDAAVRPVATHFLDVRLARPREACSACRSLHRLEPIGEDRSAQLGSAPGSGVTRPARPGRPTGAYPPPAPAIPRGTNLSSSGRC
jgi:hypothetical protein